MKGNLESTDAAPEVPYPRPTRLPARPSASAFFFFFLSDSLRLGSIRADAARFVPNLIRFAPNQPRPKSGCIGHIRSYRLVADTAETGRKRLKSALNMAGKSETCLLFFFFFVNQGIVICFLRIF